MIRRFFFILLAASASASQLPSPNFSDNQKIAVHNTILAKVNGTTISMMDVKKKMDLIFHQSYPNLADSSAARLQFYEASWRHILMDMIDQQLILADAADKEVKLTDGEVREEMETRFGPNIMLTLDKIGLTYAETWKMVREELLVRRMTGWFVQARAISQVTPQDIRQAFRLHTKENPSYQELKYRVISIRGNEIQTTAEKAHRMLETAGLSPESMAETLKAIDPSIQISSEFVATDKTLSEAHKSALTPLSPGQYSAPSIQKSRSEGQMVARIFYLSEKTDHPAPQFDTMASTLRNNLIQKAIAAESEHYIKKLRKHYGFDGEHIKAEIPEDLHPFSAQ